MSFTSYMKQKTQRNIENSIYNDKIRQKNRNRSKKSQVDRKLMAFCIAL